MKKRLALAPVLAVGLLLTGCGGAAEQAPEGEQEVAAISSLDVNAQDRGSLRQGGEVRLDVSDFGANWNPMHVDGNNDDLTRVRQTIIPLAYNFTEAGVPEPVATYFTEATEVSKSPTVTRFVINPDAVWGDGSPIDGDDMIAMWKACNGSNKDFQCTTTSGYDQMASVVTEGADKKTVTVTYKGSYPDWTAPWNGLVKAEGIKDAATFNSGWKALKNEWLAGPFKVQAFDNAQKLLTLVPNERWWGEKPLLDKVTFRAISPDAVAAAFVNNELDSFDIGVDADAFQRASGVADAQIRKAAGPNFRHFTFNTTAGLLKDKAVRQAIVRGLDRGAIGASDLAGIDWPVRPLNNHILLENQEGYEDVAARTGLDFDPEKAKADLEAAGWVAGADGIRAKGGQKLAVKFMQLSGVAVSENEALQTQNLLKEIGIQVQIVDVPIAKFQDGSLLSGGEFEILAFSWIGSQYPYTSVKQIYGTDQESNYANLSIPEVDKNIATMETDADPANRITLANDTSALIWENVHTLPLYQRPELVAVKAKLANFGAVGLTEPTWENVGYQN